MPPPVRIRYNTKARGGRPHKKRKLRQKTKPSSDDKQKSKPAYGSEIVETVNATEAHEIERSSIDPQEMEEVIEDSVAVEVIVPKTKEQKELDRKERMMEEVSLKLAESTRNRSPRHSQMMAQSQTKWNKKRKKKLEAYIVSLRLQHCFR